MIQKEDLYFGKLSFFLSLFCVLDVFWDSYRNARAPRLYAFREPSTPRRPGLFPSFPSPFAARTDSPPKKQSHFNVFSSPKAGQAWGKFMTDKVPVSPKRGGPSYEVAPGSNDRLSASKVSVVGQGLDAVLMAKLRFRSDGSEPTSCEADGRLDSLRSLFFSSFFLFPSMFQHIQSRRDWNRLGLGIGLNKRTDGETLQYCIDWIIIFMYIRSSTPTVTT
jgi:hypothetical protein